jgi:hypothetical protein
MRHLILTCCCVLIFGVLAATAQTAKPTNQATTSCPCFCHRQAGALPPTDNPEVARVYAAAMLADRFDKPSRDTTNYIQFVSGLYDALK